MPASENTAECATLGHARPRGDKLAAGPSFVIRSTCLSPSYAFLCRWAAQVVGRAQRTVETSVQRLA